MVELLAGHSTSIGVVGQKAVILGGLAGKRRHAKTDGCHRRNSSQRTTLPQVSPKITPFSPAATPAPEQTTPNIPSDLLVVALDRRGGVDAFRMYFSATQAREAIIIPHHR